MWNADAGIEKECGHERADVKISACVTLTRKGREARMGGATTAQKPRTRNLGDAGAAARGGFRGPPRGFNVLWSRLGEDLAVSVRWNELGTYS